MALAQRLINTEAVFSPLSPPINSQFLRPTASGRIPPDTSVVRKAVCDQFVLLTRPTINHHMFAEWVQHLSAKRPDRVHVLQMDDDSDRLADKLSRVCKAMRTGKQSEIVIDAQINGDTVVVSGPNYRTIRVDVASVPALAKMTRAELNRFTVDPDGDFIHWPDRDIHLGWHQFLQAIDPMELLKSQQLSTAFNQRYGEAIRSVRVSHGLKQSEIPGLTGRQLSRIEHGTNRATSNAISKLAHAHEMTKTEYLAAVAFKLS